MWRRRGSALRRVRSVRGVAAGSCAGTRGRARRQGAAHRFLPPESGSLVPPARLCSLPAGRPPASSLARADFPRRAAAATSAVRLRSSSSCRPNVGMSSSQSEEDMPCRGGGDGGGSLVSATATAAAPEGPAATCPSCTGASVTGGLSVCATARPARLDKANTGARCMGMRKGAPQYQICRQMYLS